MGLLDVLNGMQNGPRGPSNPSAQSSGGMSPMTMAILALLAYKAVKHFGGSQPSAGAGAGTIAGAMPACPAAAWAAEVLAIFSRVDWAACSRAALPEA